MEPKVVGSRVMALMEQHNISIEELSKKMKIDKKILENKLEGGEEFYLDEMIKIKNIFKLDTKSCNETFFVK